MPRTDAIDPASIRLEGVAPLRSDFEDVGAPFEPFVGKADCTGDCEASSPDGWMDLTIKFSKEEIASAVGSVEDGECVVLGLTGNLRDEFGGAPIVGEDVVVILNKSGGGLTRTPVNDRLSTTPSWIEGPNGPTHFDRRD